MKWFSERKDLKQIKTQIQINSMDLQLRNQLWNMLKIAYWDTSFGGRVKDSPFLHKLFTRLWRNFFKKTIDTMPYDWSDMYDWIRDYFFKCTWNEVYDFLEAVVYFYEENERNESFQKNCNIVLEGELSAYRFVNGKITEITSKQEIAEIEEAINSSTTVANAHLQNALRLMSDRKSPDYRNSIKESISAVEAISKVIANDSKTELSGALNMIERDHKVVIHPAMRRAFLNLFGYTSDADGIRHALTDEQVNSGFDEAKFMLVACSAFVNFLTSKSSKAGIKLKT